MSTSIARVGLRHARWAVTLLLTSAATAAAAPPADARIGQLCEELRPKVHQAGGLSSYAVQGTEVKEGRWEISGFDIDGDDVADRIVRWCSGSASIIPADPCTLEFEPSSVGTRLVFEEQRLFVFQYQSKLYVLGSRRYHEHGPDHIGIYDLTPGGVRMLCSYERQTRK